jgi:hypothetical protein
VYSLDAQTPCARHHYHHKNTLTQRLLATGVEELQDRRIFEKGQVIAKKINFFSLERQFNFEEGPFLTDHFFHHLEQKEWLASLADDAK